MNPEQLWTTTLDPDARTLLQVKVSHADDAEEVFSTLMGDTVETRREFIESERAEGGQPRRVKTPEAGGGEVSDIAIPPRRTSLRDRLAAPLRDPAMPLFVLCLAAYAWFYQAGAWNQNVRFDLVRSLAEQGTSVIDDYYRNTGDLSCVGREGRCLDPDPAAGRHAYCDKAPGASWLALPIYAFLWAADGRAPPDARFLVGASYLCTVFAVGVPTALGAVLLSRMSRTLGVDRNVGVGSGLAYGLATMVFPYATVLFGHSLAASLAIGGFSPLARLRHAPCGASTPRLLAAAGASLGAAVAVEYPCALIAAILFLYAASFVRPLRRLGWLVLGGAAPALALAGYHWMVFGGPITLPYAFSTQPDRGQGLFMGIGAVDLHALWSILFSSYRGLFFSQPWLLLAAPGLVGDGAAAGVAGGGGGLRRRLRALRVDERVPGRLAVRLGLRTALPDSGDPVPRRARRGCVAVPIRRTALALSFRLGVSGLVGWSAFLMLVATSVTIDVPNSIERPFGEYLLPQFLAGELSVNEQGIDGEDDGEGVRQAWNLGRRAFGLDGLASLAPLGGLFLVGGLWIGWALRRSPSDTRAVAGAHLALPPPVTGAPRSAPAANSFRP